MKKIKFPTWLTIEQKDRTLFFALTAMYIIYILPILLANRYYQDDLSRSLYGITGWNNDARPLTERLVTWLCGGFPIGDVHPLPLLMSVPLLAYTITMYAKRYLPAKSTMFPALCVGFSVIANPFLLSNLSYRFDCVTMIMALCATILPYVVPPKKALWKIFLFSLVLCLITLTTYQPAIGVYISLWFLEVFFMLFSERIDLPRLLVRGVACVLSVLLYKYVILNHYIYSGNGGWQPDAYRFAWRAENGFFSNVILNLQSFAQYIDLALQCVPTPLLVLLAVLIAAGMVFTGISLWNRKKKCVLKIFSLLYLLFLPVFVTLGAVAPLLVLSHTNFSISAHSLLCLCGVGLWGGILIAILPPPPRCFELPPCWVFPVCFTA